MKKMIALGMAAMMCLSMTACSVSTSSKTETTAAATEAAETTAEAAKDSETTAEAAGDLVATADYPTKPITMIIPYGAGGTTDTWGRKLAVLLEKYLGQPITVTNQGGASGSIGSQFVKEQPSDGYTLLVCAETMGTYRTMNICDLGYDDFTVISPLVGDPKVLVVGKDSKYNTLQELLDAIKENPGKITMSHSGPGGSGHNQGLVIGFDRGHYMTVTGPLGYLLVIITLTTGSAFVMWLGERVTEKGVGNGISIILLINIVSRMPSDFSDLYTKFMKGQDIVDQVIAGAIILAVILVTTILVVLLQGGVRKIPVQHAQKVQGRRMMGGQQSHIPLKVNTSSVIPVIFASSILSVPMVVVNLFNINTSGVWAKILRGMNSNYWFNPAYPWASVGLIIYILLVVFFAYFYTSVTFNPMEVANNLKKSGGFIPGIRPGKPTQDYLNKILNYIVFIGAVGLLIVAVIPIFFNGMFGADVSFGGTSLIIIVGVVLETIDQIESKMIVRNYSGFLND